MLEEWIKSLPATYKNLAVSYVEQLIRRDSSNPPGNEREAAVFVAEELERVGILARVDEFEPGRCNVLAALGDCRETGLVFLGHLDVVPATGDWKHQKFIPEREGDRLYGRGACDMKGGVAAMMAAATAIADLGVKLRKQVVLLLDSDEENANKGMKRLLSSDPIRADAAIVGEPSNLGLLLGNKGYSSFYVRTTGVSCHASRPEEGENAIYKMARALLLLEQYAKRIEETTDPILGRASFSVGTIRGGTRVNIVPDECVCEVERRLLPGESCEKIGEELQRLLEGTAEILPRAHPTPPSLLNVDHPFVAETARIMKRVLREDPEVGAFTGGTEAAYLSQFNIPTLIVGPGSLEQAHGTDEFVSVTQIGQCADIYFQLMQRICGAPAP